MICMVNKQYNNTKTQLWKSVSEKQAKGKISQCPLSSAVAMVAVVDCCSSVGSSGGLWRSSSVVSRRAGGWIW